AQSPGSLIVADTGGVPSNGTAFVSQCGICRVSLHAVDGGLFDLAAVDLGEPLLFGSFGPFATGVTIAGTREDGTTVSANVVTDGIVGFETFLLDDTFSDLVSVAFPTPSAFGAISIDNLVVRAGVEKPTLLISPPSGSYVTTQRFDLTLITVGADAATLLAATLDGADFTGFLESCASEGRLDSVPGVTLRCPVDGALFGEGTHTLEVTVELGGETASDEVGWEVLASSEP
ncbi:MAG: hypothetical protein ABFS46_12810, partial [Myxococcota bacterium]